MRFLPNNYNMFLNAKVELGASGRITSREKYL
jgi:hypothetical protein